jgi:DNA-directed RNA polymerase specialized sigma24 family protein
MMTAEENGILGPLRQLLSDRQSPESKALFLQLAQFAGGRVSRLARSRYPDLLSESDQEDVVSDVLYQLMSGTLAQFRGTSIGELLAFVRTISDRSLWRLAQRRIRERDALAGEAGEAVRGWTSPATRPDQTILSIPTTPLSDTDASYLLSLVEAGSQADFARQQGVSRAAVTQRLQRIRRRISAMSTREQATTEAWLRHSAARISASGPADG